MLKGYKTYVTGGLAILGAVASYLIGDIQLVDAIQLVVPALLGMTVRHAIS